MPLRGENIGTAYVRVIADGDGLDESIRQSFRDAEPSVREGGEHNADVYSEAYDKRYRESFRKNFGKHQRELFEESNNALTDSLARLKLADNFFKSPNWHQFRDRLKNEFGDAGELAGKRLEERFRDSTDLTSLAAEMKRIGPAVRRAQADLLDDLAKQDKIKFEERGKNLRNFFKTQQAFLSVQEDAAFKHRLDLDREFENHHQEMFERSNASRFDFLRREHRGIDALIKDINRLGDAGGSASGRGSRNNFLNFTGSVVRNLIRTLAVVPALFRPIADGLHFVQQGFKQGFEAGDTFFDSLKKGAAGGLSSIGEIAKAGIPALIAMAAAAVLAVTALGPLVSIFSGLIAGVTALAGAITFGLIGAIAPLVGLLAPLGLGLGVAVVGVLGLTKHSKELKAAIGPLGKEFKALRDVAAQPLLDRITKDAGRLAPALARLHPFVKAVSTAFGNMLGDLVDSVDSPGFTKFIDSMTTFVPGALRSLNKSILSTFGGLGGIFTALIPITNQFLGWLERITSEFSAWANSAKGQKELKQFFKDAAESARDLGDLLGEVTGLIGDLFSAGRGQGNSMLTDLTGQVKDLRTFLKANPTALKDWFDNGLETMRNVGSLVRDITKAIGQLDTPENRAIGHAIFFALGESVKFAAIWLKVLAAPVHQAVAGFDLLRIAAAGSLTMFAKLASGAADVLDVLSHVPGNGWMAGVADGLRGAADKARDLAGSIKNIPSPHINTKPAKADIGSLKNQVDKFPKSWVTTAIAKVGKAKVDIGSAKNQIDKFPQSWLTRFIVRTKEAVTDVGRLRNDIGKVKSKDITLGARVGAALQAVTSLRVGIDSIHSKTVDVTIKTHNKKFPEMARGGILNHPTMVMAGEAGREAFVPLDRPLSQVDPAVRALAAFAQGIPQMATGGVVGGNGRSVDVGGITVVSDRDPHAIAAEVVNRLVAFTY